MNLPTGLKSAQSFAPNCHPSGNRPTEVEVALPRTLRRYGKIVQASVVGAKGSPVLVVLGGISANRYPYLTPDGGAGWWHGLFGEGAALDPDEYRVFGIDFAVDETGDSAPSTGDQAEVIRSALDTLGESRAHAIIGASYGGMAALSFAQQFPERVGKLVIVSAPAEPHPMSTAAREIQRRIVALGIAKGAAGEGLALARGLAMLTYRSPQEFEGRFTGGIDSEDALARSDPGAYLHARGQAYRSIMSPGRFLSLSASIDRHRVEPDQIQVPALLIGSSTDQLVPPSQMQSLAGRYGGEALLHILPSLYGHDMFLKEAARLSQIIAPFLRSNP